ncbi:MAG: CotH kinase family protein [Acidimicrobiales bacterium]
MTTIADAPHSVPHRSLLRLRTARRLSSVIAATAAVLSLSSACSAGSAEASNDAIDLFDAGVVHTVSVDFDEAAYDAMIDTFTSTGDKDWISATVVIDGVEHQNVGLRLKGNSSLFGLTAATAGSPEELPWLIRLDKFVDGEDHQGYEEIVIRSNSTETALNEAVAQELLAATGLASQRPIETALTVNGSETVLRLTVEHPDSEWYEDHFDDENGLLYKADSEGDYSYRGDDADAYGEAFDQEVGEDDMEPLIDFLDFINNSDDATFAAELADRLDIEAFATYLAFQDLIGNADDINGRGNNSYLQYDTATNRFTVVSWDLNLAFATANVTGAGASAGEGRPGGGPPGGGRPGGGGPGDQPNVLVDRFMADEHFASMYEAKTGHLTELLFSSGTVDEVIAAWTDVLLNGASDLVPAATVAGDAEAIIAYVDVMR